MKLHFYKLKIESSVEPEEIGEVPHLEVIEANEETTNSVFERKWLRSLLRNHHFWRKRIIGKVECFISYMSLGRLDGYNL